MRRREYTENDKLICDGKELPYGMIDFWRENLSEILLNVTRGSFAEFIVQCAMTEGGFYALNQKKNGMEPWDIDGPEIFTKRGFGPSRIEVKSTASIQYDTPDEKEPFTRSASQLSFSIRPAIDWDSESEGKKRNSDLYVFCHYKAERKTDNMFDLQWWEFFVYPTYKIDEDTDTKLSDQSTISIRRLQMIGVPSCSFTELYDEILKNLKDVSTHFQGL